MKREVRPSVQVIEFQKSLPPEHRRMIKRALVELGSERGDICELDGELTGLHRLRVGRFRITLNFVNPDAIDALFIGRRETVYEAFAAEYARRLIDPDP